jgi:hypothetical protein
VEYGQVLIQAQLIYCHCQIGDSEIGRSNSIDPELVSGQGSGPGLE